MSRTGIVIIIYLSQKLIHFIYVCNTPFISSVLGYPEHLSWRMASSGMLRRVALVRTDLSEELSASVIRVTRNVELETTLALTSNRRKCISSQRASVASYS
jgi:hypothetical protein